MPIQTITFTIAICSPSDALEERNAAERVVLDWNSSHAHATGAILHPVRWERDSIPVLGDRPQALVNRQVIDRADLAIAVFWMRVGTPTGEFVSGTVEEIERLATAGKPVMVYFSDKAPDSLDQIDTQQLNARRSLEASLRNRGIIGSVDNVDSFTQQFSGHLAKMMNSLLVKFPPTTSTPVHGGKSVAPSVSEEFRTILKELVADEQGYLIVADLVGGKMIRAGNKDLAENTNARTIARFEEAINLMVKNLLIELQPQSSDLHSRIYKITHKGYSVADSL
ncbi:hypothetical protein [Georgfuchsia toluolica]|nr:hypothetical protein [Georgfuchsia toluolica]